MTSSQENPRRHGRRQTPSSPFARAAAYDRSARKKTCEIAWNCRSCSYINRPYEDGLEKAFQAGMKHLAPLAKHALVEKPVPAPRKLEYRTHAKLAIRRGRFGKTEIGLFRPGSHDLVDITTCPIHRRSIHNVLGDLKQSLNRRALPPYDERTGTGILRYITIRASHLTEELMLTFVVANPGIRRELLALVGDLRAAGHRLASVHMNINPQSTNAIFGQETRHIYGSPSLRESLCGLEFQISPTAFFQVNPWQAESIYRRIEQLSRRTYGSGVAWDLYSGIGQISMVLARSGWRTFGIEENETATADARHNARLNDLAAGVNFLSGKVEETVQSLSKEPAPALIVANPSRRGMDPSFRKMLPEFITEDTMLLYLSCDAATLARDLENLSQSSGIKLRQLTAFDMFPYTKNMEWLAVLKS